MFKNINKLLTFAFETQGSAEIFDCQDGVQELDPLFPPCKDKSNYLCLVMCSYRYENTQILLFTRC